MKSFLNRKWVLVSLAVVATVAVIYFVLPKTAWGKKMAAKNTLPVPTPINTGTQVPTPPVTPPAATNLNGLVRLQ